ncbi:phosphatidylserine decarboxylase 1 [Orobanche minor]
MDYIKTCGVFTSLHSSARYSLLNHEPPTAAAATAPATGANRKGNSFLVPGATVATILMLGSLHARRLYDDKKVVRVHKC